MDLLATGIPDASDGSSLAFGPNVDLYVSESLGDLVSRFNGTTGQLINEFGGGTLDGPQGLVFVAPVPEPSTLLLFAFGTLGLILWASHRGRRVA